MTYLRRSRLIYKHFLVGCAHDVCRIENLLGCSPTASKEEKSKPVVTSGKRKNSEKLEVVKVSDFKETKPKKIIKLDRPSSSFTSSLL